MGGVIITPNTKNTDQCHFACLPVFAMHNSRQQTFLKGMTPIGYTFNIPYTDFPISAISDSLRFLLNCISCFQCFSHSDHLVKLKDLGWTTSRSDGFP